MCAIISICESQLQKIAKGPQQSFGTVTGAPFPQCLSSFPPVLDIEGDLWLSKVTLATGEGALLGAGDGTRATAFHLTISLRMERGYCAARFVPGT